MMKQATTKIYSDHFYTWEQQYRGHKVHDLAVSVQPVFKYFKRFDYAAEITKDDSLVPTSLELFSSFIKKQYQHLTKRSPSTDSAEYNIQWEPKTLSQAVFRIYVPIDVVMKHQEFAAFLEIVSTQAGAFAFEIIATAEKIQLQFACATTHADTFSSLIASFLPAVIVQRIHYDPLSAFAEADNAAMIEFAPRHEFIRPLRVIEQSPVDPFVAIFSAIENLQYDEQIVLQILFQISDKPWKATIMDAVHNNLGQPFFYHAPEMIPCAEQKCLHPQFGIIIRVALCAHAPNRMHALKESVANAVIQSTTSTTNQLQMFTNEASDSKKYITDIVHRITHRIPFVGNSHELLTLVHIPGSTVLSKKYRNAFTRTKAVPAAFQNHPFILGHNIHAGQVTEVSVEAGERRRHAYVIGSSGMGKSNLLMAMVREDIRLDNGVAVLDPHGKLINDVLQYIPYARKKDVIILDPADPAFCFSLNILSAATEAEREVLSSAITSIFRKNAIAWGDNLDALLSNAISVFLYNTRGGTLTDVRRFLLDKIFRNEILKTVTDPQLVYFWQHEFPLLRSNSIGAIMTRLDTFLRPKAIRNMVCQQKGFDFEVLLNTKKILLVKLPIGIIGEENAFLLGQLLIAKIYQAAVARQGSGILQDFFLYVDEFHHFLSAATSITDILSGTRKYCLSLIAATQSLSQIKDASIIDSLLTNAATRICFRLGESDAKKFAEGFSSFTSYDLQNLKVGEAICRIDRPEQDFSLHVPLPGAPLRDEDAIAQMIAHSRQSHCVPRATVERYLLESISSNAVLAVEKYETKDTYGTSQQYSSQTVEIEKQVVDTKLMMLNTRQNDKEQLRHREMQMKIKEMAEQFGYAATIEQQLPGCTGQVDVVLTRDGKNIAVEISVRTGRRWEVHNIEKCIAAKYDVVVSLAQNDRRAQQIKKEFEQKNLQATITPIYFFTPDTFHTFLQKGNNQSTGSKKIRGYQVNVTYEKPIDETNT